MFGEKFSENEIRDALSLNKGSLERTIDYLLTKNSTSSTNTTTTTSNSTIQQQPKPTKKAYVPNFDRHVSISCHSRIRISLTTAKENRSKIKLHYKEKKLNTLEHRYVPSFRKGQRQRLDPRFLTGFLDEIDRDQQNEDRILAQMLQNQMYMSQLPEEFRQYMQQRERPPARTNEESSTRPRRNFWSNLSTAARKKWEQLSSQFKQKSSGGNATTSNGAKMYESLLQEDDDDDAIMGDDAASSGYVPPIPSTSGDDNSNNNSSTPLMVGLDDGDDDNKEGRRDSQNEVFL